MRAYLLLACVAMAPAAAPATAQMSAAPAASVHGRAVVAAMQKLLDEHYVLPEARPKFDAVLAKGLAAGRYDVSDPGELVNRLNEDLHTVTPDKHLGVMYNPETSAKLASAGPDAGADDAPPTAEDIANAQRRNSGLIQLRILPGNIRYLETDGFVWAGEVTERAYDDAMRFLAGGDAVIIDMRKNGGGDPFAVRYLVSHFLAPNTQLMTFYMGSNRVDTTAALPKTIAPRMIGKPLYVLTSGGTASAAEEFTGHIAGYKLGELIGENTAGAGFRNSFYPLPDGLLISISVGQAILASTGKGWEGVGFAPNTPVPVDQALDVAEAHALKRLASTALPEKRRPLEVQAAMLMARTAPVKTALPVVGYAGVYGERTVRVSDGAMTIERTGGGTSKLVAIGPNQFAYENDPGATVTFDVAGDRATALHLVRSDGSTADGTRTK
jgi:peptidase S41-like protein